MKGAQSKIDGKPSENICFCRNIFSFCRKTACFCFSTISRVFLSQYCLFLSHIGCFLSLVLYLSYYCLFFRKIVCFFVVVSPVFLRSIACFLSQCRLFLVPAYRLFFCHNIACFLVAMSPVFGPCISPDSLSQYRLFFFAIPPIMELPVTSKHTVADYYDSQCVVFARYLL